MFLVTKKIQYTCALFTTAVLAIAMLTAPATAQETSTDQFWQCISEVMVTYYDSEAEAYATYSAVVNDALLAFGTIRAKALYPVTAKDVREEAAKKAVASFRLVLAETKETYINNMGAARSTFSAGIQDCRTN